MFRALARFCPAGLLYNNHHLSGSPAAGMSGDARMPGRSSSRPRKASPQRWGCTLSPEMKCCEGLGASEGRWAVLRLPCKPRPQNDD